MNVNISAKIKRRDTKVDKKMKGRQAKLELI